MPQNVGPHGQSQYVPPIIVTQAGPAPQPAAVAAIPQQVPVIVTLPTTQSNVPINVQIQQSGADGGNVTVTYVHEYAVPIYTTVIMSQTTTTPSSAQPVVRRRYLPFQFNRQLTPQEINYLMNAVPGARNQPINSTPELQFAQPQDVGTQSQRYEFLVLS